MDADFSIYKNFSRLLKNWWVIVLLSILGALGGYTFHWLQKPIYESRAVITATIDFVQTGKLTDVEEDEAFNAVGDIIRSDEVKNLVLEEARRLGLVDESSDLPPVFVDREGTRFLIRVRSSNRETVASFADLWTKNAFATLSDAMENALKVEQYRVMLDNIENCYQHATILLPTFAECDLSTLNQVTSAFTQVEGELITAQLESKGLLSAIRIYVSEEASIPTSPVSYNVNIMVFCGAVIGLVIGIALVESGKQLTRTRTNEKTR